MANIIPSALAREGWVLEAPPTPHIERPAGCSKENQGCAPDCVQKRRGQLTANRSATCERCECMMCYVCANPINRWLSPSGQTIETVTTHTEPRFTFAYNPFDDDMKRMRRTLILEPTLTHAWYRATRQCCNTSGLVVDVGGNFGWYTLYSLALGCKVIVFEPVPAYQEVMRLGLALNPGFASRATIYGNVVYNTPGQYTLRVPIASKIGRLKKLGMTGMDGAAGILKADWRARSYEHKAASVRIDDLVQEDVCMLKADVEGYEAQVLQTAERLLSTRRVPAVQLELTRTPSAKNQTCATIKMLQQLDRLGYHFQQVNNKDIDLDAPPIGSWATQGRAIPAFPRDSARRAKRSGDSAAKMLTAYRKDFTSFSTNLIGYRPDPPPAAVPKWPSLTCSVDE